MSYGQDLPRAMVCANQADLQKNLNVLFNLVRPTKDDPSLVESSLKLVNVLPKKRIYRIETREDLDLFKDELLARPLVLQPTIEYGQGFFGCSIFPKYDCRMVNSSENYVVVVNQIHPKVFSRLHMGLEVAEKAMDRGQPFILVFSFNELIRQIYPTTLNQNIETEIEKRHTSCEHAEVVIRYLGENQKQQIKGKIWGKEITFAFEDLDELDITVDTLQLAAGRQRRSLPINQGELVGMLQGWKFSDLERRQENGGVQTSRTMGRQNRQAEVQFSRLNLGYRNESLLAPAASELPPSYGEIYNMDSRSFESAAAYGRDYSGVGGAQYNGYRSQPSVKDDGYSHPTDNRKPIPLGTLKKFEVDSGVCESFI